MKRKKILHPVTVFVCSLLASIVSLYLYIDSYLKVNDTLSRFIKRNGIIGKKFEEPETWVMILTMSILVIVIIVGVSIVFTYYHKVIQLYRMQQNFLNGFTHELKTPIASLKLFIDTFKKYDLSRNEQLEYLELMDRDLDRMKESVELLLGLAQIEDKSFRPEYIYFDLYEFLNLFFKKNEYFFKNVEIKVEEYTGDTHVFFDRKLLNIVFMNVFVNASCHNMKDNKIINVHFRKNTHFIEMIIQDNGCGISKEHIKNIFKKFYQVGKTGKGTGIGLYMVSQVMKLHQGKSEARSAGENAGTSIILSFNTKEIS